MKTFDVQNNSTLRYVLVLLLGFMGVVTINPVYANNNEVLNCGNNLQASALAELIKSDKKQQRNTLKCSDKLNRIALIKANLLLESEDIWHNAGSLSPNQLLRHNGFNLPDIYPTFGNQVEAIAGGDDAVNVVLENFLNSPPHKALILGEDAFFQTQDQIGVAYLNDFSTDHQHYWVVIIAGNEGMDITQDITITVTAANTSALNSQKKPRKRSMKERMNRHKSRIIYR